MARFTCLTKYWALALLLHLRGLQGALMPTSTQNYLIITDVRAPEPLQSTNDTASADVWNENPSSVHTDETKSVNTDDFLDNVLQPVVSTGVTGHRPQRSDSEASEITQLVVDADAKPNDSPTLTDDVDDWLLNYEECSTSHSLEGANPAEDTAELTEVYGSILEHGVGHHRESDPEDLRMRMYAVKNSALRPVAVSGHRHAPRHGQLVRETLGPVVNKTLGPVANESLGPVVNETLGPVVNETLGPVANETLGPVAHETLGPVANETLGPVANETLGPVANETLGPVANETLGPVANETLGPVANETLGPVANETLGPVANETLGPVANETLGPVANETLGPVVPERKYNEAVKIFSSEATGSTDANRTTETSGSTDANRTTETSGSTDANRAMKETSGSTDANRAMKETSGSTDANRAMKETSGSTDANRTMKETSGSTDANRTTMASGSTDANRTMKETKGKVVVSQAPARGGAGGDVLPSLTANEGQVTLLKTEVTVQEGARVRLVCNVTGVQNYWVEWRRAAELTFPDGSVVVGGRSVLLGYVSREDAGTYVCTAHASNGRSHSTDLTLHVHYLPVMGVWARDVGEAGVELGCVVEGRPRPAIAWYRNNTRLSPAGCHGKVEVRSLVLSPGFLLSVVRISNISSSDFAYYHCRATNGVGVTRAYVLLHHYSGLMDIAELKPEEIPTYRIAVENPRLASFLVGMVPPMYIALYIIAYLGCYKTSMTDSTAQGRFGVNLDIE
nr:uncharacterized protein LOC123760594 [Procambarus clarkii]